MYYRYIYRYYNQAQLFREENYSNSTNLSSYEDQRELKELKKIKKETPILVWEIIRTLAPYTNIKQCSSCLHGKLAILIYPNRSELLNKRAELVSKCRLENKFLLQTFNSND